MGKFVRRPATLVGHVTSAGVTNKVATVRTTYQKFDKYLKRHYTYQQKYHISDPTRSLHTNDVVRFAYNPYLSRSKNVTHTVTEILAPWGPPLSQRPPLLSDEERAARRALQVFKRGGKTAAGLRKGRFVVGVGGRLHRTPAGELGWKKFAGVLEEADKGKEGERERKEEGRVGFVDKEGKRRWVQGETMRRVKRMRERAEGEVEAREGEGGDVVKRMEGLRVSGGEVA